MKLWNKFAVLRRFLLGGAVNTLIGSASITSLQIMTNNLLFSNLGGYLLGSLTGYMIHSIYTFKAHRSKRSVFMYGATIGISYSINLIALFSVYKISGNAILSQALAMSAYILASFALQARFVFPAKTRRNHSR